MRKIVAILIVIVIAAGAWWYASPIWTLRDMRDAAKAHDAARLSAHVDYPALREDLRADLGRYMMSEAAKRDDAGSKLGAVVAMALLGRVVDAAVSPAGVEAMFTAQDIEDRRSDKSIPVTTGDHPIIERDGLDSFRVHGKDPSQGALLFHRSGLSWKLVGVDLPTSDAHPSTG